VALALGEPSLPSQAINERGLFIVEEEEICKDTIRDLLWNILNKERLWRLFEGKLCVAYGDFCSKCLR
jgi:uncharacterized phage-like protein YoqJ